MKKQHRIISLLLVFSLLLGSLVFTVSAEEPVAAASDVPFEPTATLVPVDRGAVAEYSVSGHQFGVLTYSNHGDDYKSWYVDTAEGNRYLQLVSQPDEDGKPDDHVQYIWIANDGNAITYDPNTPIYVVYEADIATEGDLIHLAAVGNIRTGANSTGSDIGGHQNLGLLGEGNPIDFDAGEFHHLVMIHDYVGNKIYYILDDKIVTSCTLLGNSQLTSWQGGQAIYDGMKLQSHSSYPTTPLVAGESLLIDNANCRVLRGSDAAGNLAEALAKGNLAIWNKNSLNGSYDMPEVPALASVNGTEYNNTKSINNALASGIQKKVEILRDSATSFTVDCDAIITTHGYSNYTLGNGATSVDNGNGTVTVTASFKNALVRTEFSSNNITNYADYKSSITGNNITGIGTGNNTNMSFITISKGAPTNGDPFLIVHANETKSYKGSNNNLFISAAMSDSAAFTVKGEGAVGYYVIDLDIATQGDILSTFDISVAMRQADENGKAIGGTFPFSDEFYVGDYITATDSWSHVTIVGDLASNVARVYVNGEHVANMPNAVRHGQVGSTNKVVAQGFRLEIGRNNVQTDVTLGDNVFFDNLSHRLYPDGNESLKAAIAAGDITAWSAYSSGRGGEQLPVIASVNGEDYYNTNDLAPKLFSNEHIDVEFASAPIIPVDFQANATIDTNGIDFASLVALNPACSKTFDGNYVYVTTPYIENRIDTAIDYSDNNANPVQSYNLTKGNHPDNLYSTFNIVSANGAKSWGTQGYRAGYIVTNPFTGDQIYRETATKPATPAASSHLAGANEYVNYKFTPVTISYEAGKNEYIVMDYDFAYEGTLDGALGIQIIPRKSGSGRWATSVSIKNLADAGLVAGDMVHITAVFDYTNNKGYYFFDGVLAYTINGGAVNDTGYTEYKSGTALKVEEYKFGPNSMDTYYLADMNIRYFDLAVANDTIDDAIAAGDISKWTDSIYKAGTHNELPTFATVNGVECGGTGAVEQAIASNEKSVVEVFHSNPATITVNGIATIETHGLNVNFVGSQGSTTTVNGTVINIASPNELAVPNGNTQNIRDAIQANNVSGNIINGFSISDNGTNDKILWGNPGGLGSDLVTNKAQNNTYYKQYYIDDGTGVFDPQKNNDYIQFTFEKKTAQYDASYNEYVIIDYDIDFTAGKSQHVTQQIIGRNAAGITNNTSWCSSQSFVNFGLTSGEFCHVTTVYDFTNNYARIFVNGKLTHSVQNGVLTADCHTSYIGGSTAQFSEFRVGSNTFDTFCLDNIAIRYEKNATSGDSIQTAINSGYLSAWTNNIYTSSYVMPEHTVLANVNGEAISSETKLANILTGRKAVEATFFKSPSKPLEVTVDAVIETNGFANTVVAGVGGALESEVGTVKYFSGSFKPSADYIEATAPFNGFNNIYIPGSIYSNSSSSEGNPGALKYYKYTDLETKNPYYLIAPNENKTTKNTFMNVAMGPLPAITATSYFIFDIDVATESEFLAGLGITIQQRSSYSNAGGTDFNKVGDSKEVIFADYVTPSDKWAHLTIVGDIADNKQYIFVNGVLVGEQIMAEVENYDLNAHIAAGDFKCHGTRVNIGVGVILNPNSTTLIDGLGLRYYNSNEAANNIEAYIQAGSLEGYAFAEYGRMGEKLPAVATINGVEYSIIDSANAALAGGENITVSLDRESLVGKITVSSTGKVTTNGFDFLLGLGYAGSEEDGVVTITIDESTGYVTVEINGKLIYEGNVRVGSDVSDILAELGAQEGVYAGNGHIFENVTWNGAEPGIITGDTGFSGTGTEYTKLFYIIGEGKSDVQYTAEDFHNLLSSSSKQTVILNGNITVPTGNTMYSLKKDIYLNGYELTFEGTGHAFSADNGEKNMGIYGPGAVNNLGANNTQAFVFAGYNWTGSLTLKNLTINASQALTQFRAGKLLIENCEINALSNLDAPLFSVGEDYNGNYSKKPIYLDIINSTVNFRSTNASSGSYVPMFRQKIVSAGIDPNSVINITGSTLIAEGGIFESLQDGKGYTTSTTSNLVINIEDSTLIAQSLAWTLGGSTEYGFRATLNFVDNVKVNSNMTNLNCANKAGLVLVKSNDHAASDLYSSEYATVTWANGTTEYWADGSVPVNAEVPFAKVAKVEAGQSYTFDQAYGEAPFALKGNLTLGANLGFNLYIPAESDLQSVEVNGVELEGVEKAIDGNLYYCYTVELTALEAVSAFDVVFTLANGDVIARTLSVAAYANIVYAQDPGASEVTSATLKYIVASAKYFGYYADASAINALLVANPATGVSLPTSSSADTSGLNGIITSAQLNIQSTLKFRFNLADGVDGNDVEVTVNGVAQNVEIHSAYVEVELRAYEMGDMMTITVDGKTGTFDLAYYITYAKGVYDSVVEKLASDSAYISGRKISAEEVRFYSMFRGSGSVAQNKGNLLKDIYSYYVAAAAYKG